MELLQAFTLAAGHIHHHLYTLHGGARRAVSYTSGHSASALGKTDVADFAVDFGAVGAFVFYGDAVVVVDAWRRRLIGIDQIVIIARKAGERLPRLVFLLGTSALHDVGLGYD